MLVGLALGALAVQGDVPRFVELGIADVAS